MGERERSFAMCRRARESTTAAIVTIAVGIVVSLSHGCASPIKQAEICRPASCWLAEIEREADPKHGVTEDEVNLVERIRISPGEKVDCLIPLLGSTREDVRELAAYSLSQVDGLEAGHVKPVLSAALREGSAGSLPWVLARIDSSAAINGMMELLRADPVTMSPVGYALNDAALYDKLLARGFEEWAYPGLGLRVIAGLTDLLGSTNPKDEPS